MMILGVEWSLLSNVHVLTAKFSGGSLLLRRLAPLALSMARLRCPFQWNRIPGTYWLSLDSDRDPRESSGQQDKNRRRCETRLIFSSRRAEFRYARPGNATRI